MRPLSQKGEEEEEEEEEDEGYEEPDWVGGSVMEVDGYTYSGMDDEGYGSDESPLFASSSPATSPLHSDDPQPILPQVGASSQRMEKGRSCQDWLQLFMDAFMVRGTHSLVQWLLDLRTYGLKIHYSNTMPGQIGWTGTDTLLYQQLQFSMGDFRGFVHGLVHSTRQLLRESMLLGDQPGAGRIPPVPWPHLWDDPTKTRLGWSFLRDQRTWWPVDGTRWLRMRVAEEMQLQQRFIQSHWGQWNWNTIDQYLRAVARFQEKLGVLVHVMAGQPAWAPELLSIWHWNTENVHWNVFIKDGMVALVTWYHKGFYASNDVKVIH